MSSARILKVRDAATTVMRIPEKGYSRHLVGPDQGAQNVHELISTLHPGAPTAPYHYHERAENIYHVLSGNVELVVDDRRYQLGPDDIAFIPPGVAHAVGNPRTDVEARILGIYAPSPRGDFHVVPLPDVIHDETIDSDGGDA